MGGAIDQSLSKRCFHKSSPVRFLQSHSHSPFDNVNDIFERSETAKQITVSLLSEESRAIGVQIVPHIDCELIFNA